MLVLNKLKEKFLFFDGAMGTMLQNSGLITGELPEEYNIENSALKRPARSVVVLSNFADEVTVNVERPHNIKYFFTTKSCPNCNIAKEYLQDIKYVTIDAEQNMELAQRYGVMQAPTLVVVDGDSHKKYVNASNIKKYIDHMSVIKV